MRTRFHQPRDAVPPCTLCHENSKGPASPDAKTRHTQ